MLQTEPLIAPVYYITAGSGPNEGAVITRNRDNCRDLWLLNTGTGGNNTQDWYLLETNYVSRTAIAPTQERINVNGC